MRKLIAVFVLVFPLCVWAQSPFDGTWKMNLTDAKFAQKPDTWSLKGGQYTCTTCIPKVSVKADGTDQKVAGAKEYDTIAVKQVDDKTVQFTRKKDGKTVNESTDVVSADGKSLTSDFKGYPPQGDAVTGKVTLERVGTAPAGAHPISGSWRVAKVENVTDNGLTFTYKATPDGMTSNASTGEAYEAKFDGKEVPVKNDRGNSTVSLKKLGDNSFQETYKQDGKVVAVYTMSVDGNTMKITAQDPRRGTTSNFTATKQ